MQAVLNYQPSPMSSTSATPANSTPVSPRSNNSQFQSVHFQSRQLRPPKAPLYVPAVLRPTERQAKQSPAPSPITPPRSVHGSLDAANESPGGAGIVAGAGAAAAAGGGGESVIPENVDSTPPALSRRTTVDSNHSEVSKLAEDEWLRTQNLGEIAGFPSRDHWKADAASSSCDSPVCKSFFGLFLRRHHCRHCGHVFCSSHTPHVVRLDHNARFHPDGVPSRACDLCWRAFRMWEDDRAERLSQIERDLFARLEEHREQGGGVHDLSTTLPATAPQSARPGGNDDNMFNPDQPSSDMVASSVPRDWSWSTF